MRGYARRVTPDDRSIVPTPVVSVVISNYNYARYVASAIESALQQDHRDVEIIVVDDGSTDRSLSVIECYLDRVIGIFTDNRGQGNAINTGFAASSGDVVIFLDADDRLKPWAARRLAETFADRPDLSRVQFPLAIIDDAGRATDEQLPPTDRRLFSGDARPRLLACPDDIAWQPTSGNAFSRQALCHILPMEPEPYRLCADYHLSTLAPLYGRVAVIDAVCGEYRIHGANGHIRRTTVERVRDDIRRTLTTRSSLIDHAHRLGYPGLPADPVAVRSISHAALRTLSFRIDRGRHPVRGDTRHSLARLGLASVRARRDLDRRSRAGAAAWIVSLLVAPRPLVRRLATPLLGAPLAQ